MTARRLMVLASASLITAGCRSTEFFIANAPNSLSRVERHLNIPYGTDPRQRLDVVAPKHGENLPVVIFWYGG